MYSARKDLVARGVLRPGGRGVCNPAFVRFGLVKSQKVTSPPSGATPEPMPVPSGSTAFRIDLPNGTTVSFDRALDAGTLHQVLQTAAALS